MPPPSSDTPSSQTVTQTQQIPQFEQDFSQANQNLAASLASTPYPTYGGAMLAPWNIDQTNAVGNVANQVGNWQQTFGGALTSAYNGADTSNYWNNVNPNAAATTNAFNVASGANPTASMQNALNASYSVNPLSYSANAVNMGVAGLQGTAEQRAAANNTGNALTGLGDANYNIGVKNQALDPSNVNTVMNYMSPYVQASLMPQLLQANTQFGQQQLALDRQSTMSGAFGDARQGVAQSLNNYYNNQTVQGIEAQGFNTAFNNSINAIQGQENLGNQQMGIANNAYAGAGQLFDQTGNMMNTALTGQQQIQQNQTGLAQNYQNALAGLANTTGQFGINEQNALTNLASQQGNYTTAMGQNQINLMNSQQNAAQGLAGLSNQYQQQNMMDNQALYQAGSVQQQQQQQALNLAYQQFQNQVNWPFQMENVRESALSNSPYNMADAVTLPSGNTNQQNLNAFQLLAGASGGGGTLGTALSPQRIQ